MEGDPLRINFNLSKLSKVDLPSCEEGEHRYGHTNVCVASPILFFLMNFTIAHQFHIQFKIVQFITWINRLIKLYV